MNIKCALTVAAALVAFAVIVPLGLSAPVEHTINYSEDAIVAETDFTQNPGPCADARSMDCQKARIKCPILRVLFSAGYVGTDDVAKGSVPYPNVLKAFQTKLGFTGSILSVFQSMGQPKEQGGVTVDGALQLFALPQGACCTGAGITNKKKLALMKDFTTDVDEVDSHFSAKEWGNLVEHMASNQWQQNHQANQWPLLTFQYSLAFAVLQENHTDADTAPRVSFASVEDVWRYGEIPADFKPADTGQWIVDGDKLREVVCKEEIVIPNTAAEPIRNGVDSSSAAFPRDLMCGADWRDCKGDTSQCSEPGQLVKSPPEPEPDEPDLGTAEGSSSVAFPDPGQAIGSGAGSATGAEEEDAAMGEAVSQAIAKEAEAEAEDTLPAEGQGEPRAKRAPAAAEASVSEAAEADAEATLPAEADGTPGTPGAA